jgi:uncharacterized protein (TIGR03067 family)
MAHTKASDAGTVLKAMEGKWRAVYSEVDGEMTPVKEFSSIVLEHKGNTFTVEKDGKVVDEGHFSVNTRVSPHELVYVYRKGPDMFLGGPRPGVVQVEDSTLKMCMGPIGHRPPSGFNTFPDSEAVLTVFQRVDTKGDIVVAGSAVSRTRAISQW